MVAGVAAPQRSASTSASDTSVNSSSLIHSAIFTQYNGLPAPVSDPPPSTGEEKLAVMLSNLDKQHAAVRQNMLRLAQDRKAMILEEAYAKLRADAKAKTGAEGDYMGGSSSSEEEKMKWKIWERGNGQIQRDLANEEKAIRNMAAKVSGEDADFLFNAERELAADKDGDFEMGGMSHEEVSHPATSSGTTADQIRESTSRQIESLIFTCIEELNAYDERAKETRLSYEKALRRDSSKPELNGRGLPESLDGDDGKSGPSPLSVSEGTSGIATAEQQRAFGEMVFQAGSTAQKAGDSEERSLGRSRVDVSRDPRRR